MGRCKTFTLIAFTDLIIYTLIFIAYIWFIFKEWIETKTFSGLENLEGALGETTMDKLNFPYAWVLWGNRCYKFGKWRAVMSDGISGCGRTVGFLALCEC